MGNSLRAAKEQRILHRDVGEENSQQKSHAEGSGKQDGNPWGSLLSSGCTCLSLQEKRHKARLCVLSHFCI